MGEAGHKGLMDRVARASVMALLAVVLYVLSSGPVLATAFWLREATQWNGFYAMIWVYAPLFLARRESWIGHCIDQYITWWVNLFGTVGPG